MRYTFGYNQRGNQQHSVITVDSDGVVQVVLTTPELTELQAKAIAMILNAPDPH